MKRYLTFILLLAILPVFIKAYEPRYCSKKDFDGLYNQVKDVVVSPVMINSTKEYTDYKFRISAPKKPDKPLPAYTDYKTSKKVEYLKSEGIYRIYGKTTTSEDISVYFKLNPDTVCYPEILKQMDYKLLYVNPYSKNKKCLEYPKFEYCAKNFYFEKDEKEVEKLFAEYIKSYKENEKKESSKKEIVKKPNQETNVFKKIKYFINKNILFIALILIIIILGIYFLKSKKNKKILLVLLILLLPNFISANVMNEWEWDMGSKAKQKPQKACKKEDQQREIAEWCRCTAQNLSAVKSGQIGVHAGSSGCGSYPTSAKAYICTDCYGFCFGPRPPQRDNRVYAPVNLNENTDFDQEFGEFCNGSYKSPMDVSGYCCYYNGDTRSKYRYFNGENNKTCSQNNMRAVYLKDATDCQNSTCNDYKDRFDEMEQFCNEFADANGDSAAEKSKLKEACISTKAYGEDDVSCGLPIRYEETKDESCTYNSPSNGDLVFSAMGKKKNSRVFAYPIKGLSKDGEEDPTKIYLEENCEYAEGLEMRASGSRYAFINTLTINNGRYCKYKIYNGNNILRNLMATVFRPRGEKLSCEQNRYCKAINYVKKNELKNLLKGNKTDYSSTYTIRGQKEDGTSLNVSLPFQYKGEALKVQSKMLKAKDTGERLNTFGVYGAPTSNFERETTANTAVTMNMQVSCYSFPNNVLRQDGTCFPAYFADKGVKQAYSNATFSTSNGFLCGGQVNTSFSYKDNPPAERCPSDGSGGGYGSGSYANDKNYIEYSPYCEIIVHAPECGKNPSSNIYDLRSGYRAGLKINSRIKAVNYRIANRCVNRNDVTGYTVSTLKGTKSNTHIYAGVIDDKNNFYYCKRTLIHEECPKEECTVTRNGDDYSVSGAGDMEKNGVYVRKGRPFQKFEYEASDSPNNLKMYRIYENKVNSKKSDHLRYYKDNNLINMAEPGFRHSIFFMICENNNCRKPKLCESPYEPDEKKKKPEDGTEPKPKDPNAPDCITDLEHEQMKNAEAVRNYCSNNYAKEYGTDGTMEACLNKCYNPDSAANTPQLYRRIKYSEPFPNNRSAGWNWFGREDLINQSAAYVKANNKNPLWTITLKQSDSYNIRNANRRAGYDPYYDLPELTGDPFQKFESNFLKSGLRDVKKNEKKLK